LLTGVHARGAAVATRVPRLDLLPATVDLSGAEIELVGSRIEPTARQGAGRVPPAAGTSA
jgi:hypothetical protein